MTILRKTALALALSTLCVACGHVAFYSERDMRATSRVGYPVCSVRPYIMVSRIQAKDAPLRVEIVHLSDVNNPLFADVRPGIIGSSKMSLTLDNCRASSINAENNTQVSELLTAAGGIPALLANAAKTREEAGSIRAARAGLVEQGASIGELRGSLETIITAIAAIDRTHLQPGERRALDEQVLRPLRVQLTALQSATDMSAVAPIRQQLAQVLSAWSLSIGQIGAGSANATYEVLGRTKAALTQLVADMAPQTAPAEEEREFTLYEIVPGPGSHVSLREVELVASAIPPVSN